MYIAKCLAVLNSTELALMVEQEVSEFDDSLEYTARPRLKSKQTNKINKEIKINEFPGRVKS